MRVTTWSLEMLSPPSRPEIAAPYGCEIRRVVRPALHFYRYLYETVGREWLWVDRRRMGDAELAEILGDPRVELWVCWHEGSPAGYAELDARVEGEVELAYFGLVPEMIGRGIGPWLLDHAVRRAWQIGPPRRVWVRTCSLDHPAAKRIYERAGFVQHREDEREVPDPRPLPVTPR